MTHLFLLYFIIFKIHVWVVLLNLNYTQVLLILSQIFIKNLKLISTLYHISHFLLLKKIKIILTKKV
jgi:hypothetical protein